MKILKTSILIIVLIINFICNAFSQSNSDKNIISYYAVGNSLDGQPLIDSKNALRFFPVFIFREITVSVRVSAYIGSKIFNTEAIQSSDYSFWQANLPDFKFGEAIQRLEVETKITLDQKKIEEFEKIQKDLQITLDEDNNKLLLIKNEILTNLKNINNELIKIDQDDISKNINEYDNNIKTNINAALKLDTIINNVISKIDKLNINSSENIKDDINTLKSDQEIINKNFNQYKDSYSKIATGNEQIISNISQLKKNLEILINGNLSNTFNNIINNLVQNKLDVESIKDTLKKQLVRDMYQNFVDTNLVGPQVKESDIIIDIEKGYVRILYRNYKPGLRQLPALDPAEKLGVFRIRYIPFPVVADNLYRPFTDNSIGVFEVGLGFSDVTITGDDFIKPTLSAERLGVAFAITQKLFKSDAEILALVLTYDFNAYGSLGIGANFAYPDGVKKVKPYYSFGINKKAFEDLIVALGKFFNGL